MIGQVVSRCPGICSDIASTANTGIPISVSAIEWCVIITPGATRECVPGELSFSLHLLCVFPLPMSPLIFLIPAPQAQALEARNLEARVNFSAYIVLAYSIANLS